MNWRRKKKAFTKMLERMGISGQRDEFVKSRRMRFPELHGKEIEFVKPFYQKEKLRRQECFRQSCIAILGEDPNDCE